MEENKVQLVSSDNVRFEVERAIVMELSTLKYMIEDTGTVAPVPLPNVSGEILEKVIYFYSYHVSDEQGKNKGMAASEEEMKARDEEFMNVDSNTLLEIIKAANYLDARTLLDTTCRAVANLMKDMSVEAIRDMFGIENDFTPEEEEQIRQENQWAFD